MIVMIVVLYEASYPNVQDRERLEDALGRATGFTALLGTPRELDTVGGFLAWRIGAILAIILAVWTVLTVTRQLRGEEELGRWDMLLAGRIRTTVATATVLWVVAQALGVIGGVALAVQLLAGLGSDLPVRGAVLFSMTLVMPAITMGAVAAVTAQVLPSRRSAAGVAGAVLGVMFLLRVVADAASSLTWTRWLTPVGWTQEVRPFAGDRVWPLLLIGAWTALLAGLAALLAGRRDSGAALLSPRDTGAVSGAMLSSPESLAVRLLRGSTAAWVVSAGTWVVVMTLLAPSVADAAEDALPEAARDLFGGDVTVQAFLGFGVFQLFAAGLAAVAAGQIAAARDDEAVGRLDAVLSRPIGRHRWLAGRALIAASEVILVATCVAMLMGIAAAVRDIEVSAREIAAGATNGIPLALLFLGAGILAFGVAPRLARGAIYVLLGLTFLLRLVGDVLDAPPWIVGISPFHHLPLVPLQAMNPQTALLMTATGVVLAGVGITAFGRRDLTPG